MTEHKDGFAGRWGFLLAALGMAVGAGNLWRFPRLAGQYGGSFLFAWFLFLFLWSIPLIMVEFAIGKKLRLGVIGAFARGLGQKYAWMGWYIGICTIGIMFYYSVICGWSIKYFLLSLSGKIYTINQAVYWQNYTSGNFEPVIFNLVAIVAGLVIIFLGVQKGIEKTTKVMIPFLFILMIIAAIKALTLPNAGEGLNYFFRFRAADFLNYRVWLEALSQSAWSTGAGWGLILTYATYTKKNENIFLNSTLTGLGDNLASMIIGLAVIPTVFALSVSTAFAQQVLQSGNQGLTFIYIPQLFNRMTGGVIFTPLFFLVLFIASVTSLISMQELSARLLMDYGWSRKKSVFTIGLVAVAAGGPSAYSLKFFNNQDWVWGVGLLISGFFFVVFVLKYGIENFKNEILEYSGSHFLLRPGVLRFLFYFIVVEFMTMFVWWMLQSLQWYPDNWWNPFEQFSLGSCLLQWSLVMGIGILFNRNLSAAGIRA